VFSFVLTSVECSSSLSSYLGIQAHSNGGDFDELNFCALREWSCVCESAVSVYFMLTSSVDLSPTEKLFSSNLQKDFSFL